MGPSAIGAQAADAIAVSPAYQRTGLVVATAGNCDSHPCLWASHDGGATWHEVSTRGWSGGAPVVAVDGAGHDVMFAGGSGGLQRSDDGGATWTSAGAAGNPTILPSFARDGGVTVASGSAASDYVIQGGAAHAAAGSGGALTDLLFAPAPQFPSSGGHNAALLLAVDGRTRVPSILQCTGDLTCSGAVAFPASRVQTSSGLPSVALASDYAQSGVVFASLGEGAARSSTWGASFTPMSIGDPTASATSYTAIALSPGYRAGASGSTAYESLLQLWTDTSHPINSHIGGGVYASSDGGSTWRLAGTPGGRNSGTTSLTVAPDGRLFAGYTSMDHGGGLLCSVDGGATWKPSCPAIGSAAKAAGPTAPCCAGATGTASPTATATGPAGAARAGSRAQPGGGGGDAALQTGVHAPDTGGGAVSRMAIVAGAVALLLAGLAGWRRLHRPRTSQGGE